MEEYMRELHSSSHPAVTEYDLDRGLRNGISCSFSRKIFKELEADTPRDRCDLKALMDGDLDLVVWIPAKTDLGKELAASSRALGLEALFRHLSRDTTCSMVDYSKDGTPTCTVTVAHLLQMYRETREFPANFLEISNFHGQSYLDHLFLDVDLVHQLRIKQVPSLAKPLLGESSLPSVQQLEWFLFTKVGTVRPEDGYNSAGIIPSTTTLHVDQTGGWTILTCIFGSKHVFYLSEPTRQDYERLANPKLRSDFRGFSKPFSQLHCDQGTTLYLYTPAQHSRYTALIEECRVLPPGTIHGVQTDNDSFFVGRHGYSPGSFARSLGIFGLLHEFDISNESPPSWSESTLKAIIMHDDLFTPDQFQKVTVQMGNMGNKVHNGLTAEEKRSYKSFVKFCKEKAAERLDGAREKE